MATRISPWPGTGSGRSPTRGVGWLRSEVGRMDRIEAILPYPPSPGNSVRADRPGLRRQRRLRLAGVGRCGFGRLGRIGNQRLVGVLAGVEAEGTLLQPSVLAVEHAQGHLVLAHVVVGPQLVEQAHDLAPRAAAEEVRQLYGIGRFRMTGLDHRL